MTKTNAALVEGAVDRLIDSIGLVVADLPPTERAEVLVHAAAKLGELAQDAFGEIEGQLATVIDFELAGGE